MTFQEEYALAVKKKSDVWVAACGGVERPFNGYLYVFNPFLHQHGWLNLGSDIVERECPFAARFSR